MLRVHPSLQPAHDGMAVGSGFNQGHGGEVVWSPLVEFGANLKLWLRADLGVTISSGRVASWADQSGQGNNVSQSTVALRPLSVASDSRYNGRSTVDMVGGRLLQRTTMTWGAALSQPFAWFVVGNISAAAASTAVFVESPGLVQVFNGASIMYAYAQSGYLTLAASATSKRAFVMSFNTAPASRITMDNGATVSGFCGGAGMGASLIVGASTGNLYSIDAPLAEIFCVSGVVPTAPQMSRFFTHSQTRYGTP